jgi:hypothetical protein
MRRTDSLPTGWGSPGQLEANYTAEAHAALSVISDITVDGYRALNAAALIQSSATFLDGDFSTMTPKFDIVPR